MRDVEIVVYVVLIAVILMAAFAFAVPMLRNSWQGMNESRQDKKEIKAQQQLALMAPAALRGDALLPIVIDQGKKLQTADALFDKLVRNDIDVFMPTEMQEQIKAWQATYQEEK